MTGPINADRFDEMRLNDRRMRFLEAWVKHFGGLIFQGEQGSLTDFIDLRMYQYPELLEETEVVSACDY